MVAFRERRTSKREKARESERMGEEMLRMAIHTVPGEDPTQK